MSYHLTPLEVCERLIGGPEKIAHICGLKAKAAYPWRKSSEWHDPGDIRATRYQRRLLAWAKRHDVPLTAEHLICGAKAHEIDDLRDVRKVAAE